MHEIRSIDALRTMLEPVRARGARIGLVPTMGSLHAGHLSLVDTVRRRCDLVVMSLFVNPLQFGPGEDFDRYPRDEQRDYDLARRHGVDVMFAPATDEMYRMADDVRINAGAVGALWEGAVRPGHFDGVLTVVAKLFNIVDADVACFGQKDIQQVTLIRRMIAALNFRVNVIVAPIVREGDGLAMSSRNVYLDPAERAVAPLLFRSLQNAQAKWAAGETRASALRATVEQTIAGPAAVMIDYVAIVEPERLSPVEHAGPGTIVAVAARLGRTRLIDNVILGTDAAAV